MTVLDKEYFTTEEVADLLKVDKETVLRWIRRQQLSAFKVNKSYRISETDLRNFLESLRKDVKKD